MWWLILSQHSAQYVRIRTKLNGLKWSRCGILKQIVKEGGEIMHFFYNTVFVVCKVRRGMVLPDPLDGENKWVANKSKRGICTKFIYMAEDHSTNIYKIRSVQTHAMRLQLKQFSFFPL